MQVASIGFALSAVLAAVGFGVLNALPTASRADRLAVGVLEELSHVQRTTTQVHLAGHRSIRVTCVRGYGHELLAAGHLTVILSGSRIVRERGAALHVSRAAAAALADLAVCPGVVSAELANRVLAGPLPSFPRVRWHERLAYRFRISHGRPILLLYVFRKRLSPVGAVFVGRQIHGWSIVRAVTTRRQNGGRFRA